MTKQMMTVIGGDNDDDDDDDGNEHTEPQKLEVAFNYIFDRNCLRIFIKRRYSHHYCHKWQTEERKLT